MSKLYTANVMLWHTKDQKYVQPGELVDLSHLKPEGLQKLLDKGFVAEASSKPLPSASKEIA